LLDRDEARISFPFLVKGSNGAAYHPRCDHNNILARCEVEQFVEDVISTGNDDSGVALELRRKLFIENARLYLVRHKEEQDYERPSVYRMVHKLQQTPTVSDRGGLPEIMFYDKTFRFGIFGVVVLSVGDQDLLVRDTGVAQVLGLRGALIAKSESR